MLNSHTSLPRDRGQAQVEFLLSVGALIFVVVWILQFLLFLHTYGIMAGAAKEGIRYAIVHGSGNQFSAGPATGTAESCDTNVDAIKAKVLDYAQFTGLAAGNVTVCYLDGNNGLNNRVRITVSYPFSPIFNLVWTPPAVRAAAQGRIVY
jgi:hypothetical protein